MVLLSNAKINIGLHLKGKRPDGYHDLESVFYPIPLADSLEISESKDFHFYSKGYYLNSQNNLVVDAFNLIKCQFNIPNVSIKLDKKIPVGAGLGGGSSNATHTLLALNKLFHLNLTKKELLNFALQLGSDCPFFLENKPTIVSGRGEILTSTSFNLKGKFIKIINSHIHISTKQAFDKLELKTNSPSISEEILLGDWMGFLKNDFEDNAVKIYPEIANHLKVLKSDGALFASLTGSGSSVYGIFDTQPKIRITEQEFIYAL